VRWSAQNKRNERSHEVMATSRLDATGRPWQQTRQESRDGVVSITTNDETHRATTINVAVASSPQLLRVETNRRPFLDRKTRTDRANTCPWFSTTRAAGSLKTKGEQQQQKLHQKNCAINVHHHDNHRHSSEDESRDNPRKFRRQQRQRERKRERRDRQKKQKQAAKTSAAAVTRSTNSASESTGSVRDTVPNKTKQARGTTKANTILVDSTHKKRCGLWCCLALISLSRKSSPTKRLEKIFGHRSWLGCCVQRRYLANFEIASDADLKNGIQVKKTRAKY
jgi:hypothetical protein